MWVLNQKIGVVLPPKSSIFNRVFHYFHHPFWGTLIFGNTHVTLPQDQVIENHQVAHHTTLHSRGECRTTASKCVVQPQQPCLRAQQSFSPQKPIHKSCRPPFPRKGSSARG